MRFRLLVGAVVSGALIAASVAACGPPKASSADATSSATASSTTTSDTSPDSLPFGSVGGGFDPLAGAQVASVTVGAGQTVTVPVAGQGGVPTSGVGAVALSVAVTGQTASGSVSLYPAGGTQPDAPSLSWAGRDDAPGLAVSELSSGGAVAVHNASAHPVTVTLGADGYWLAGAPAAAGAFGPLTGGQVARVPVGPGQTVTVPVAGQAGVPASGAGTVALTVEAVGGWAPGSVTVYPTGNMGPNEPSLKWPGQVSASGLVVSALGRGGAVSVRNSSAGPVTVTLAADGYWLSGMPAAAGTFGSLADGGVARAHVGPGQTLTVPVAGRAGIPATGVSAVALTIASRLVISELSSSGTITFHNPSAHRVTVTIDAAGYFLSQGRVVSDVVAKPTTVTLSGSDITGVSGDPASSQTVTLTAGAPVPAVGRVVVASPSATDPDGLLGIVTAVSGESVTLSPATLDQAYSTFDVSSSQVLTDSDVSESTDSPAGQTDSVAATPMDATTAADAAPSFGYDLNDAAFTCDGSDGGPTITLTADLSKISVDLSLDANPAAPNMHFLVTADPVFGINVGFTGKLDCKLSDDKFLTAKLPIPGTPGLFVDLGPVVELTADGQASIDFQWEPRAAFGFDKGPGVDSETHGFGSSGSVGISASADAELFLGFSVDITLAGQIGVGGDFGPDLPASYDSSTGCVTVDGQLKADLTAEADVFVKDWSFTLATGTFDKSQLYQKCGAQTSPSQTSTSSAAPSSSGPPSSGAPSSSGPPASTTWTVAQPPLPADADNTSYSALNDVSCPSATSCLVSGYYTDTSGAEQGALLTWSDGTWTATQAPYIYSMSCPTPSFCVSVDGNTVETWSGGTWTLTRVPNPADDGTYPVGLESVWCVSASSCVADGNYTDTSGNTKGVLETLSDGTWTVEQAPLPSDAAANPNVYFTSGPGTNLMSCVSASFCVAAGSYTDASGGVEGLLETWSNGTWTATQAPLPADAAANPEAGLLGLSCPAASRCLATGIYNEASGESENLLETWSGSSWSATTLQMQNTDNPGAVACVSASSCVIAGFQGSEVLTSSGGSWTITPLPSPPNGMEWRNIENLSCASASDCFGVGTAQNASNPFQAVMATGPG
jgi:hypothetical protein